MWNVRDLDFLLGFDHGWGCCRAAGSRLMRVVALGCMCGVSVTELRTLGQWPIGGEPVLIVVDRGAAGGFNFFEGFGPTTKFTGKPRALLKTPVAIEAPIGEQFAADDNDQKVGRDFEAGKAIEESDEECSGEPH